ncbi:hypothetical protein GDO81_027575 [Engystomops pustulosus]|uniref:Uncharacterized protein n=1 Tax=Engystomops pustulosus TaxID=76066 RepID=A0AAV6YGP6_ENGPU|nr:hypothetical protein GDO81_027575 [Engystomops pustulosus]
MCRFPTQVPGVHLLLPGACKCLILRQNLNLKSRAQSESVGSSDGHAPDFYCMKASAIAPKSDCVRHNPQLNICQSGTNPENLGKPDESAICGPLVNKPH